MSSYLTTSLHEIPNFQADAPSSCVIFSESEEKLLLVSDNKHFWNLPGVNIAKDNKLSIEQIAIETLNAQVGISVEKDKLVYQGKRFARLEKKDRIIHFFRISFDNGQPTVKPGCNWISLFAFQALDIDVRVNESLPAVLKDGRVAAFNVAFGDRYWHKIENPSDPLKIELRKGEKTLTFDQDHRLVLTILGKPKSGKNAQAHLMAKMLGGEKLSYDDIYAKIKDKEIKDKEIKDKDKKIKSVEEPQSEAEFYPLVKMIDLYTDTYESRGLPSQVFSGIIGHGIGDFKNRSCIILRRYPDHVEQCEFFLNSIVRSTDGLFSFILDMPDNVIKERNFAEAADTPRLSQFHEQRELITARFNAKQHQIVVLEIKKDEMPSQVFQRLSTPFQNWLDTLYLKQKALIPAAVPPLNTVTDQPAAANGLSSIVYVPLVACAFVVGAIASYIIVKSKKL